MPSPGPVLVVDDDAVSRHVLAQALSSARLATEVVTSGAEALAWLAHKTPSLVLLDLVMPPPDGFMVLRSLRADARTADVPVLVLTALDTDEDISRAFEIGADDFVRKPFRPVELIARIRGQLRMREYVEALGRKERDAKVVLELTQALASSLDFRNILFTVVRRIAEVARVDRCSIVLVRDQGDVGYVVAASDDREIRDLPISLGKYPEIRQVMQTGEPLVIEDAATHPLLDIVRSDLPAHGFRSLALLPILYEDKPMGVLFLRGRRPVALREHELSLARTVANATAIALRNARILQTLRDQTEESTFARFEAERRLKALQRYADFFHSAADGIVVMDTDGQVLFSNPRARAITGRSEAELAGAPWPDMVVPRDHAKLEETWRGFAQGVFPHMVDLVIRRVDGEASEERTLSVSFSSVLREESGAILVSFRDVTDDRATVAELAKARDELRTREKQAIIAELAGAAAHELNQPLTSVLGYAELIRRRLDDSAAVDSAASVILQEAERMANIVSRIGRITRYETKVYVGAAKILDLDRSCDDALSSRRAPPDTVEPLLGDEPTPLDEGINDDRMSRRTDWAPPPDVEDTDEHAPITVPSPPVDDAADTSEMAAFRGGSSVTRSSSPPPNPS